MKDLNRGKPMKSVWEIYPPEAWEKQFGKHPAQKPVALLERILLASSHEGDLVLDPFCGSGTTLLAAMRLRRDAFGCEMSFDYISRCAERRSIYAYCALEIHRIRVMVFFDRGCPSTMNGFCLSSLFVHFDAPFRRTEPSTWPWIVYVWLGFLLLGWLKPLWTRLQREQAKSWPTASGRIDSASLGEPKRFLGVTLQPDRSRSYVAVLAYSYSLSGAALHGEYRRRFATEREASEFLRDLAGQPVAVQYHPNKPGRSMLLESTVETLLRNRPPAAEPGFSLDALPDWLKPFLGFFAFLSLVGLILSLWVHIGALFGRQVAPAYFFSGLHVGIFVVFIPAIAVAQKRVGSTARKDFWKAVTEGSPDGLRYLLYFFFAYAMVNFFIFFVQAPTGKQPAQPPAIVWRGFSGHWMLFYCASFAILTSALNASHPRT